MQEYEKKKSGVSTSGTAQTQSLKQQQYVEKMQGRIVAVLKLEHAAAKQQMEQTGDLEAMSLLEREQRHELETLQNVFRWESHFSTKMKFAKSFSG
jgi:hypothetical protein